jgi:hypothetical protein
MGGTYMPYNSNCLGILTRYIINDKMKVWASRIKELLEEFYYFLQKRRISLIVKGKTLEHWSSC